MGTISFGSGWGGRVVEGKFPLLEWLGGSEDCGSFSTVLGGMQEAVIQVMLASDVQADAQLAQWNFAKTLLHPHLSKILAAGRSVIDNLQLIYVVTEPSDGSLSKIIRNETMQADRIREIFNPVLSALSHLHKNGVVHGHINPTNIQFAGTKPRLSVTDLLIAGSVKRRIGTPGLYDAPEVQHDSVTAAADAWAIGMIMHEAMTHAQPTLGSAEKAKANVMRSLPGPFREIVQDCLQSDPLRRCTIDSILERLNETKEMPLSETLILPFEKENAISVKTPVPMNELAKAGEPDAIHVVHMPDALPTEETEVSQPVLFSKSFERFEEAHLKRFRIMPYAVVVLAVITLIAVLLVRRHKVEILPPVTSDKTAATTGEAAPQKQPAAPDLEAPVSEKQSTTAAPPVAQQAEPQRAEPQISPPVAEKQPQETPQPENPGVPSPDQPSSKAAPVSSYSPPKGDTNGAVVKRVLPNVSPGAFAGMRSLVEVQTRVSVTKDGKVSDAAYVSPGPGNYFARVAQRAARSWEFSPPTENGKPERSVWTLQFHFARDKTEATATPEQR